MLPRDRIQYSINFLFHVSWPRSMFNSISNALDLYSRGSRIDLGLVGVSSASSSDERKKEAKAVACLPVQCSWVAISPRVKRSGASSLPPTSNWCRGQENANLYVYSLTLLHGVVHN
jgi:hypothetical protein